MFIKSATDPKAGHLYFKILDATLTTYSEWIRGDMLRKGRQEHYLREIIAAIIKRYNTQVTWNSKSAQPGLIQNIPSEPLPLALWKFEGYEGVH